VGNYNNVRDNLLEENMSNFTYKKVRKLKNGKVELQLVDEKGKESTVQCHDPVSCREHAILFVPLAAGLGTLLNSLPEEDEVSESVSLADYDANDPDVDF
jgi:hypothetical protein